MQAGIAASAEHLRLDRDPLADGEILHILPEFHNFAGNLMALGHRVGCIGMCSVVNVNVAAADADLLDLNQNLVGTRLRNGNLPENDIFRLRHNLLYHHLFHYNTLYTFLLKFHK